MKFPLLEALANRRTINELERPEGPSMKRRVGADDKEAADGTVRLSGAAGAANKGEIVGPKQKMIWDFVRRIAAGEKRAMDEYIAWLHKQPQAEQKKLAAYFKAAEDKLDTHNRNS